MSASSKPLGIRRARRDTIITFSLLTMVCLVFVMLLLLFVLLPFVGSAGSVYSVWRPVHSSQADTIFVAAFMLILRG